MVPDTFGDVLRIPDRRHLQSSTLLGRSPPHAALGIDNLALLGIDNVLHEIFRHLYLGAARRGLTHDRPASAHGRCHDEKDRLADNLGHSGHLVGGGRRVVDGDIWAIGENLCECVPVLVEIYADDVSLNGFAWQCTLVSVTSVRSSITEGLEPPAG